MPSLSKKERKRKLRVAIKELNDELLNVVKIQDKMEKMHSINEEQVIEIDKLHDEIWKFDELIKNLYILLEKSSVEEEIEATKEKIMGLQTELECKEDSIMQEESKTFEIFSDLYYKRLNALNELDFKGEKLANLGVSKTKIDEVKKSNNLGQSVWLVLTIIKKNNLILS